MISLLRSVFMKVYKFTEGICFCLTPPPQKKGKSDKHGVEHVTLNHKQITYQKGEKVTSPLTPLTTFQSWIFNFKKKEKRKKTKKLSRYFSDFLEYDKIRMRILFYMYHDHLISLTTSSCPPPSPQVPAAPPASRHHPPYPRPESSPPPLLETLKSSPPLSRIHNSNHSIPSL